MKENILRYLKEDVRFRERKNKNKGIANTIMKMYGVEIPLDKRDDIINDILTADRAWRQCLAEYKELRGADYDDKEELEQKAQLNLGYEVGYRQDIKRVIS